MENYRSKLDTRTIVIILLTIIILPLGYLGIYYIQCTNGPIKLLEKKYGGTNLQKNCQWSEKSTYLQCIKTDYYKVLRETGPFDSHLAFLFEKTLFRLDRDKQFSDSGKANNLVDHLELGVNFLLIRRDFRVYRTNLHAAGFLLAYLTRDHILDEFYRFENYIQTLEDKYAEVLGTDKVLNQRFSFVKREFSKLRTTLADFK